MAHGRRGRARWPSGSRSASRSRTAAVTARRNRATRPANVSAEELQSLFEEAAVGQKESDVLARFPAAYQHYTDNLREDCYEWRGASLYNLCFRAGVLRLKTTF